MKALCEWLATLLANPERRRDRRQDQIRIGERSQRHEEDAVGEVVKEVGSPLQHQARLARAPGTCQGEEPHLRTAEELDDLQHLLLTTQEGGWLQRQVIRAGLQRLQ